jgi:hypothetical protein
MVSNEHSSSLKLSYGNHNNHSYSKPMDINLINTIQPLYNSANVYIVNLVESPPPVHDSLLYKAIEICASTA